MLDVLRREVGAKGLAPDDARWAIAGRAPVAVVQPENAEQVAAVLALCTQEGFAVEAAGAGTWLNRGPGFDRDYLVVSTARLTGVGEYEPEDLTIGVQAGIALHQLQDIVAANRQLVALDPPAHHNATVGAVVALGSAGPLRCRYGTPRDQVLGLEVVTGDGRVLQVGGRVVKNVAGYDVARLLVGSQGTLAVITRVHLKLRPRAQHDVTWVIPATDAARLLECAAGLYEAQFEPAAVELVRGHDGWKLLVRVHGNDEAIAHARAVVRNLAGSASTEVGDVAAAALWKELLAREAAATLCIRCSHLPAKLPQLVVHASAFSSDAFIAAHVYDGIVRICLDADTVDAAGMERLRGLRDEVVNSGGTVIMSALPATLGGEVPRYGPLGNELRLMEGIKRVLDPGGVLAPGRFVL